MVAFEMSKQECKVFIGGLSWDTNDTRLRTYFENFGVVKEAFVSYDRETGKPRGFGFVVFEDSSVADRVVQNKHTIDRREVDAKHAMPRHDNSNFKAVASAPQELPSNMRKIFVGGLPASVVDSNLRQHFERYGAVEDAVVMIDHQSKRPRGFGFVTFMDEKSLDNVLKYEARQTLHGKEVEIKRAVPRDQLQQISPRNNPRTHHRGYDTRAMPYPQRFVPPGVVPFGYGMEAHPHMERHLHAYYGARMHEPDMSAHLVPGAQSALRMDMGEAMPSGLHWPPPQAPDSARADAAEQVSEAEWASRGRNGHDAHMHAMQNVGNLPMYGVQPQSDSVQGADPGSHAKSQPVPFAVPQKGHPPRSTQYPGNGTFSASSGGADAFENLASSLGASLPLSGGTFLHGR